MFIIQGKEMKNRVLFSATLVFVTGLTQAQLFNKTVADDLPAVQPLTTPAPAVANTQVTIDAPSDSSALADYLSGTRDLEMDFTQTVYSNRGQEKSSGHARLSKPGKFYWDYQSPDRQKIISDGKNVWQYDLDLEQISVRGRDEMVGDVAMEVLSGEIDLNNAFITTQVDNARAPVILQGFVNKGQVYQLTPKEAQDGYDSVWVAMENGAVKAVMVDAGRGQQSLIIFSHLKRNQGIPASRFDFTPPAGVDVIGTVQ